MSPENPPSSEDVDRAIQRLDRWLETMRGDGGYTGPIVHWWESCWLATGPMIDWRYEGIILGYLELFRKTNNQAWLDRAMRAADDALAAQTPDGHFGNSSFQFGAQAGGTPHEAAVDVGLFQLARAMREHGLAGWERYASAADENVDRYLLGQLWTGDGFADQPDHPVLVPNKNATIVEALLLSEETTGRSVEQFVHRAARVILAHQVAEPGERQGATIHSGTGQHALTIGIYTARCVGALVRLHERTGDRRYQEAAIRAGRYLARQVRGRGTRLGHYADGRPIGAPTWISPSGDVARALLALAPTLDEAPSAIDGIVATLVRAQYPTGGIPTAHGFAVRGSVREWNRSPEFRDVLPVVGWCDKTFRLLAMLASPSVAPLGEVTAAVEIPCTWRWKRCLFYEDERKIRLTERSNGRTLYRWRKGAVTPDVFDL